VHNIKYLTFQKEKTAKELAEQETNSRDFKINIPNYTRIIFSLIPLKRLKIILFLQQNASIRALLRTSMTWNANLSRATKRQQSLMPY
jgi:hypothetical protein